MKTNKIERSQKKFLEAMKKKFEDDDKPLTRCRKLYSIEYHTVIKSHVMILAESEGIAKAQLMLSGHMGMRVTEDMIDSVEELK